MLALRMITFPMIFTDISCHQTTGFGPPGIYHDEFLRLSGYHFTTSIHSDIRYHKGAGMCIYVLALPHAYTHPDSVILANVSFDVRCSRIVVNDERVELYTL